jgi:hypothetical protein
MIPLIDSRSPEELHPSTVLLDLELNTTAILILRTSGRMHHPMHLHGVKFEVLEQYSVDLSENCHVFACKLPDRYTSEKIAELKKMPYTGLLKDTIILPAGGAVVLRFPVDNPGSWLAHCQILLHKDDGMTFIFREGGSKASRSIALPEDYPVCPAPSTQMIMPSCNCYFDEDSLSQSPDDWICSRSYLCLHNTTYFPDSNFIQVYNPGIETSDLNTNTPIILSFLLLLFFGSALAYTVYHDHLTKYFSVKTNDVTTVEPAPVGFTYLGISVEFLNEWHTIRNDIINRMRFVEVCGLALITGIVFFEVGNNTTNRGLRELISLLFFSVTLWTFTRMYPAIPSHHIWLNRTIDRIIPKNSNGASISCPSFIEILKISLCRSACYLVAEGWWPMLYGLIAYPIAHINGKLNIWFQNIGFLIFNNMCYISFGAVVGVLSPSVQVAMISSTLYAQTSLVCAGFYRTLPEWLSWIRWISYVWYTYSGIVRGELRWYDSYSCRQGDARTGQLWCLLETAGIVEDMKLRGINVANSSDPEHTADVSLCFGMLVIYYLINVFL